jgi:hypothetical protein
LPAENDQDAASWLVAADAAAAAACSDVVVVVVEVRLTAEEGCGCTAQVSANDASGPETTSEGSDSLPARPTYHATKVTATAINYYYES